MPAKLARPPRCMPLLRYTSRCGRWMSTVSRYGATTLTGRVSGPLMTPALWMTASIGPRRFTCSPIPRVSATSDRSPVTASAPRSSRSRTAVSRSRFRAWTTTRCPCSISVCAAARPRPSAEPVMKTRAIGVLRGALRRCCALVLLVSDVLAPRDWAAALVVLLHGDVDHEAVRGGAVPVVLARLEEDTVAGADRLDRAAFALAESGASVTKIVWPWGCVCQAVRAPGVKCTAAAANVEVPAGAGRAGMWEPPVNQGA